jgi:hypothetical protein
MIIRTDCGDLTVLEPPRSRVDALRDALPMGAMLISEHTYGAKYGIVMQCGMQEVYGVWHKSIALPKGLAMQELNKFVHLTSLAIPQYLESGFSGVLMPIPCMKQQGDLYVVGIAYFGAPCLHGLETYGLDSSATWDSQLGTGFSRMLYAFSSAISDAQRERGLETHPSVGFDCVPRLSMGNLFFGKAIHAGDIFLLQKVLAQEDPCLTILRCIGINQVYHLPSVPFAIPETESHNAWPAGNQDSIS